MAQLSKVNQLVGGRVRLRRIQLKIGLASLAASVKIPETQLKAFEAGRERISAKLLVELARALGVRPAYFFQNPVLKESAIAVLTY